LMFSGVRPRASTLDDIVMSGASSAVFPKPGEWFGRKLATARPGSA
jgi:hypothetical protein